MRTTGTPSRTPNKGSGSKTGWPSAQDVWSKYTLNFLSFGDVCLLFMQSLGRRLRQEKDNIKRAVDDRGQQMQVLQMSQPHHCQCRCSLHGTPQLDFFGPLDLSIFSEDLVTPAPIAQSPLFDQYSQGQIPALSLELPTQLTVLNALYINSQILGLSCRRMSISKSSPASPLVPLPLHPTPNQLLNEHYCGIDLFPFPKMRDSYIILSGVIDEDDLVKDIFMGPSFTIAPGASSWDPRGWKIENSFAEKWGFLFY